MKKTLICRADPQTLLRVRGSDAAVFLQGQFTNDLRRAQACGCTYGLWLNQKGRVLADSHVLQRGPEEFTVVSLHSPVAVIRERLDAYIIADDVELEDATAGHMGWILGGQGAAESVRDLGFEPPAVGDFSKSADGAVAFRARATGEPNWYVAVAPEFAERWTLRMAAATEHGGAAAADPLDLMRSRIAAGIPEIPAELGPADLPNEGGLEHEAISFTKGCYLGQEVMARLHNLGQVRRRLFVLRGPTEGGALARGTALFIGEKKVGEIRSMVPDATGPVGLAMLHTSHVRVGDTVAAGVGASASLTVACMAEGRAW